MRALVAAADAAASSALVDRLLRGRAWVVGIGLLLAGIVFFNVALLELNGGIARMEQRAQELKRSNAALRLRVAELGSSERIQEAAAREGFVLPAPGEVSYLRPRPGQDARLALAALDHEETEASAGSPPATPPPGPVAEGGAPAATPPSAAPQGNADATAQTGGGAQAAPPPAAAVGTP